MLYACIWLIDCIYSLTFVSEFGYIGSVRWCNCGIGYACVGGGCICFGIELSFALFWCVWLHDSCVGDWGGGGGFCSNILFFGGFSEQRYNLWFFLLNKTPLQFYPSVGYIICNYLNL